MIIVLNNLFVDKDFESFSGKVNIDTAGFEKFLVKSFSPCDININMYKVNDKTFIDFKYDMEVIYSCARCLTSVPRHVTESFSREILEEGDKFGEDIGVFTIKNGIIDVETILSEALFIDLEPSVLCSENCKGLCPKCGANLNEGECDCDLHDTDPRFSKLINLKDKLDK